MGPARRGAGPTALVPGGLFWTRRRAGVGFRWVVPDTHDYFLPRPGRLSSKSGPGMIISCGGLRLVGSTRHRKVVQIRGLALRLGGMLFQRTLTIYGVARGLVGGPAAPKSCTRTPTLAGWCSRCCADGLVSQSWGGVPKSCPRIFYLYTTASQVQQLAFPITSPGE